MFIENPAVDSKMRPTPSHFGVSLETESNEFAGIRLIKADRLNLAPLWGINV
jgi:hypothetical protein